MRRWMHIKERRTARFLPFILAAALLLPAVLTSQHLSATPLQPTQETFLSYTFLFKQPTFTDVTLHNQTFTKIDLADCFSYAEPGYPTLPVYPATLLLPAEATVTHIHVKSSRPHPLNRDVHSKPILPEQEFTTLSNPRQPAFSMHTETYNQTTPVFNTLFEDGGVGYCRGYAIQTIYLYPVTYIPKTAILTYYPEITITLELTYTKEHTRTTHPLLRNTNADHAAIKELVANPSMLSTYATQPLDTSPETDDTAGEHANRESGNRYEPLDNNSYGLCNPDAYYPYVIITSQSLKHTTGYPYNWSSLITHRKTHSGLNGTIVTVQDIEACGYYWNATAIFNDTQARIRAFCKDAYLNWGTEYILLGGDWDGTINNQIVPYRLFTDREETETYNTMACDMYYSHLDGTWYYAAQGIWGGGKNSGVNDFYGELYVGRIPVYNASMISNAVQKIIWYDLSAEGDWLAKASFLGGDLGWTATSKQYMEEIRLGTDTWRTFTGFEEWNTAHPETPINTQERIYHADVGSTYKTPLSNSIINDNASILNHLDHSNWNTPFGLTNWLYRINTKPFFGFSQGCLAGRFHAGYAGPEQLLCRHPERHAYALVLNTGYGYGSSSSTNGPSQYIHAYFFDYFFNNQSNNNNNWQLGKANLYAHDKIATKSITSHRVFTYTWYSTHLFGDPAQTLRITDNPENITISNENPSTGSTMVPITTSTLSVIIQHSQNTPFSYIIQTQPHIGSSTEHDQTNGQKTCMIANLTYSTTYTWFVNATDGTITTNHTYSFTTQPAPVNLAPLITNPSPLNQSTAVSLQTTELSITIQDPEGDPITWSISTIPHIGNSSGTNATNSTKTCVISNLSAATTYTWSVHAYDGQHWTNQSFWFTTEALDITAPQITTIQLLTSDPIDLDPAFGWENITCQVTDTIMVHSVLLILTYPDATTITYPMTNKHETSTYYYNTSLTAPGQYSYQIWANDSYDNQAYSDLLNFSLPPNWDINNDGQCNILDLLLVSNVYNQIGTPGWIREDVDNNGQIQVLDLILVANNYGETWWITPLRT